MVIDLDQDCFVVIWETTRACRREARALRDPWELNGAEGESLLDQAAGLKAALFILAGGNPLGRRDLEDLIRRGKGLGMRMSALLNATEPLEAGRLRRLKAAGLDRAVFELDGHTAAIHDTFRGVEGSFALTLQAIRLARKAGLQVQVTTTLADWNYEYLEEMIGLLKTRGLRQWDICFLIPKRKGNPIRPLLAGRFEEAFERLRSLNREKDFSVKLLEAPQYRRFAIEKEREEGREPLEELLARPRPIDGGLAESARAFNAGRGMLFVDHVGNVCPSPNLRLAAGNIRAQGLTEIYRTSPLFRALRDPALLKGKCGRCEYAAVCGGSRARAYAATGDYLEADPACSFSPRGASVA